MVIVTSAVNPAHRIAFGTLEQAQQFVAAIAAPADWLEPEIAGESLTPSAAGDSAEPR